MYIYSSFLPANLNLLDLITLTNVFGEAFNLGSSSLYGLLHKIPNYVKI